MTTNLSIPQGATVLTIETPVLIQLLQAANSVITPYVEALEKYEHFTNLQQWCETASKSKGSILYKASKNIPDIEDYDWSEDELTEYNNAKQIYKKFGSKIDMDTTKWQGIGQQNQMEFAKKVVKNNALQPDIKESKSELDIAERAVNDNIQYVNLIPPNYRYPLALSEIQSYLENLRAENWKEAVNQFEEQLHRWQMEQNSEEALLLQAQTAVLAGQASSRAGTAALFSGLSFFLKR